MPRRRGPDYDTLWEELSQAVPGTRLRKAADASNAYVLRRPTGILTLDAHIGGGLPAGGVTELVGLKSSGKNLIANCAIRQNQRLREHASVIVVLGTEYGYDKNYARMCGVKIADSPQEIANKERKRAAKGLPFTEEERAYLQEQVGEIRFLGAATAEPALDLVCEIVARDFADIILIDSVADLLAKDEEEKPLAEAGMSSTALPKLLSRWLRKLSAAYFEEPHDRPNLTSIIAINQMMDKIGGFSNPNMPRPTISKGGHALKHGKLLGLKVRRGQNINSGREVVGHSVHWTVDKGKAGCGTGAVGEFNFFNGEQDFAFGPDSLEQALLAMYACGMAERRGSVFKMDSLGINARGRDSFLRQLAEHNPEWYFDFYEEVMRAHGLQICTTWET